MSTRTFKLTIAISAMAIAFAAQAGGGPSGPEVTYPTQGHIGEVVLNPFKVPPSLRSFATAATSFPTSPSKCSRR